MAQMTIPDGAQEITDRLRQAQQRATARDDANSHLLAATILTGLVVPEDEAHDYFLTRDPAADRRRLRPHHDLRSLHRLRCHACSPPRTSFPLWAVQTGLVQFYGMDIDATCVKMAQVNFMLYGLNGFGLHCALTATPRQLASLPEPFRASLHTCPGGRGQWRHRPGRGDRRHNPRPTSTLRR